MTVGVAAFPRTKFHRPPARAEHVERSRLLDAIAASPARVVLVTAPPGYGKSTLLAQWAARCDAVAWVSLDTEDTGPRLWSAVLTALDGRLAAGDALEAAEAPDADLRSDVLIPLLDALADADGPLTIVLDDLHLVADDSATIDALDWLLARLPAPHQVLIAARRDPGLEALTRLRIAGDALDIRTDDLRFGGAEVRAFVGEHLGLGLAEAEVAALDAQTEGWPAALYLAALPLRAGRGASVGALGGRELFGALTDEVLRSAGVAERRLLLDASLLDRMTADLTARIVGGDEATTREAFASLARESLLLVPLDEERTWFRFHHLLRDELRSRLRAEAPDRVRTLHRRAATWLETEAGESEVHDALAHYVAAGEWDAAAELLARHALEFVAPGGLGGRAPHWLAQFPASVVRADARLCFVSALLAALDGDGPLSEAWLADGRRAGWEGPMPDGTASYDLAALSLTAMLCVDDLGGALTAAERALAALPAASPMRATVAALSAWHAWLRGDAVLAERLAIAADGAIGRCASPLVGYLPPAVLALTAAHRSDLRAAARFVTVAEAARDTATVRGAPHTLAVTCAAARLATTSGDPGRAAALCRAGLEHAREWRDPSLMVAATLAELAVALTAAGDAEGAAAAARARLDRVAGARDAGVLGAPPRRDLRATPGVEELSTREVEVLAALSGTGSLREVADALFISRNTIKTHTRALYAKLGVASREEAVARGRDLGLLHSTAKEVA